MATIPNKRLLIALLGIVVFVVVGWFLPCPDPIAAAVEGKPDGQHAAMICLGSLLFACVWWIGSVAPNWVTALMMVLSWSLFARLPWEDCISGFMGETVWLVAGVFVLAYAFETTGLLRRITFSIMRVFKPTYRGQVLAILISGTVITPLVPSAAAKTVFGSATAAKVADAMGYDADDKGRSGLFVASFSGYGSVVTAFLSGSALTYMARGLLPAEVAAEVTWLSWFVATLPWLLLFLVGIYLFIVVWYKPGFVSEDVAGHIAEELDAMGGMSRDEKVVASVGIACIVLWAAESFLGISSTVVALMGVLVLFATKVIGPGDPTKAIPWGLLVFIGCVLGLGKRFSEMGISDFLASFIAPVFQSIPHTALAIIALFAIIWLTTFFLASQAVPISIFMAIMPGLLAPFGVHPFIVAIFVLLACNCYFVTYQNLSYIAALERADTVPHREVVPAAVAYAIVSLTACLCCLPYWSLLGYIA